MLQLILGRAGYGKTEYVFSKIKSLVESGEKDILLLVPEQFSFVSERRLLTDLKEDKVGCVDSFSFSRLGVEISSKYGGDELPVLTKGARAVMMKRAIETVQDSLRLFNRNITSNSFINSVLKIYDEMKSCRVSIDDILDAADNTDKEILSLKLRDIASVIGAYDALIEGEYYDSENELTRLYNKLLNLDYFVGKTVFIDGFSGFVAQEYKIIEVILKQAKKVYITFCTDSFNNTDRFDLFSYVNSNIDILKGVNKKINSELLPPIVLVENKRAKSDALKSVEKFAFSNIANAFDETPEDIRIYRAKNISDECDDIASQISKLLRGGWRAGDITVICRDLDMYQKELKFAFDKFNIPYFNDERQDISSQPLMMLVNFLLRSVIYSYRSDDIFSLLKTGLTALEPDDISALENYVFVWNINGSQWKNEFTESPRGFAESKSDSDIAELEKINKSRSYIIGVISQFAKRAKGANCRDICKALYYAITDFKADERLKDLAVSLDNSGKSALAEEQGKIWDLLMEILDKLATVGEDTPMALRDFYKLFHLMIENEDLGTIPTGLDNVQIGSADRIRCDNPRAVFVAGANEGEFPQAVTSAGLLSETDRVTLINNDFKLYSYGEILNAQEKYFAYMAVSSASEKLYISYRDGLGTGTESSIVRGVQSIYPNLKVNTYSDEITLDKIESKDNAFELLAESFGADDVFVASLKDYFDSEDDYKTRLKAVCGLNENNEINIENTALATELFKKNMYLSASRIEDYFNCAFRYFCKFGLGARPLLRAEMDPMQTGTVIHYVLEQIIKENGSKGLTEMSDEAITISVNTHLESFLKTKMGDSEKFTPRFKYQFMRLSKMLVAVVLRLRDEFSHSDFEAKAFELTIGDGSDGESVKSAQIPIDGGGSIKIKGAVDRVDVYEENGKQYIRVVDYKSGNKEFSLSDILYGLNLQMFIYLFTLAQSDSEYSGISSGVLYMHSARPVFLVDRAGDSEAVEKEENKRFKMRGVVLNDAEHDIAKHMEHDLEGRYIPVKYSDKKGFSGNVVTLEELGIIANKIESLISQMGASLHSGKITQNPVNGKKHDKTCEFCDYRAVCMNRREVPMREIEEFDNAKTLDIMKGGDADA
ncbi:MAG: PD-(D/E)XK nuclease family protein [Eubacterium sp.]|nr:PD-(D/E)XK nuclease family protein [Eubacterium sp.]